jgi:L-2-amino-thiazoline-4-carboxylic acid hydrolase
MATEHTLRQELEDAFRGRAHLYRVFLDELESELGPQRAEALMVRALEARGREVAAALFTEGPVDPIAAGDRFLAVSPDGGQMYPHEAERRHGRMTIRVHRCPLKDAWAGSGLPPDRVATLCRIAGAFDRGLFEAAGLAFSNQTWTEARGGGCCWITLENPAGSIALHASE